MLRIRTKDGIAKITARLDRECEETQLKAELADLRDEISSGFDTLLAVTEKFSEVKIDKDGALHCKVIPAPTTEE